MRARRLTDERGIALALAVFALVVIGALVAGTFFAGRLEQQTGQNTFFTSQAAEAAEAGITDAMGTSTAPDFLAIPTGGSVDLQPVSLAGRVVAERKVDRLTQSVFLISSLGRRRDASGNDLATRSVGALVRLQMLDITVNAGLKAIGTVTVSGNSTVNGHDQTPPSWSTPPAVDCPTTDDQAGVIYNGTLSQQGSATVDGEPPSLLDPTLTKDNIIGGSDFDELKALATLILTGDISGLAPAVTGTPAVCDASVESNWGAPTDNTSPCFNYFPIIYHKGDLSLSGSGAGQGVLLVEGNLNAQGRIDFYGPVIVTGAVSVRGTGSDDVKFYGGIMAQDVTLDDTKLTGNATVNYSSCAIRRALAGSATIQQLAERSWVQLY